MKLKLKSLLALIMSAVMVLSLTACGEDKKTDGSGTTTTTEVTTVATNATDPHVQEVVGNSELVDEQLKGLEVTKKIKWMAWWDIDETTAPVEMFKSKLGIPEEGSTAYGEDYANDVIIYKAVAYLDRYDKLATAIQGGDSPDIFPFEANNFPYSAYKNMFKSIDGIVDTNGEEWSTTRDLMDQFMWGGKNYCAIVELSLDSVLWYLHSTVEEAGLEDPYELYKNGEWTWSKFLELAQQFKDSGEGKYVLDGYHPEQQFLSSTGSPLVEIIDGKLVDNLYSPTAERVAELLSTMCKQDYRYPRHILNNFAPSYAAWYSGNTLFFQDGTWRYEETWYKEGVVGTKRKPATLEGVDDIWFVPFPKDDNADKYYQLMKQDSYMLCSGSTNEAGFKAFTYCCLASSYDSDVKAASREKRKNDYGWTDEQLDFIDELITTFAPTAKFDFKNGIGQDIASTTTSQNPIECLFKDIYLEGVKTYAQLREEGYGEISARINEMNASVS